MAHFEWDENNLGHIAEHGVSVAEAEYVLGQPTLDLGFQDWYEEERFQEAGATASGRILVVITTWRGLSVRVVTAFDAPRNVAEEYLRSR